MTLRLAPFGQRLAKGKRWPIGHPHFYKHKAIGDEGKIIAQSLSYTFGVLPVQFAGLHGAGIKHGEVEKIYPPRAKDEAEAEG